MYLLSNYEGLCNLKELHLEASEIAKGALPHPGLSHILHFSITIGLGQL